MCGRFTVTVSHKQLQEAFPLFELPALTPRFNIAPTQSVLAVRQEEGKEKPQGTFLRWGLVPSWADDLNIGNRLINARADGIDTKPSFRTAFKKRRCLILADGFYEWRKPQRQDRNNPCMSAAGTTPFRLRRPLGTLDPEPGVEPVDSCTILTTAAQRTMAPLHDRMPVILDPADYARWLDPATPAPAVAALLRPYPATKSH